MYWRMKKELKYIYIYCKFNKVSMGIMFYISFSLPLIDVIIAKHKNNEAISRIPEKLASTLAKLLHWET